MIEILLNRTKIACHPSIHCKKLMNDSQIFSFFDRWTRPTLLGKISFLALGVILLLCSHSHNDVPPFPRTSAERFHGRSTGRHASVHIRGSGDVSTFIGDNAVTSSIRIAQVFPELVGKMTRAIWKKFCKEILVSKEEC